MNRKIDLHTHTTFSDGTFTPKELLDLAKEKQISALSITDHDTIDGIQEAINYGNKIGIEVIPGLEISTDVNGEEVHLLGYFIDYKDKELKKYLKFFKDERLERGKRIIKKLNALGMKISISDVQKISKNSAMCRPHIAKAMVQKNLVKNFHLAFHKYIGDHAPASERKIHIAPRSAIKIINDAGGLAVLAHPSNLNEEVITSLIDSGIDGIEVIHPSLKKYRQKFFRGIVNQYCLLETGGSDYHGGLRNDDANFGKFVTSQAVLDNLKNMVKSKLVF